MDGLIAAMKTCRQTPAQSVLEHGQSVWLHLQQLADHLAHGTSLPEWWRVPPWTRTPGLLERLAPTEILEEYTTYHDAGKVVTRVVDAERRQRFPGHAAASEAIWLAVGGDPWAARLMGMDMDVHLLRPDGVAEFAARPEAASLLLAAVAEVHSNARMFGGVDSDGFKIKAKHLHKRGGQAVAAMGLTVMAAPLAGKLP